MLVLTRLFILLLIVSCASRKETFLDKQKFSKKDFIVHWAKNLDPIYETGNLPIGTSSPLILDEVIYIGGLDGKMRALDLMDGRVLWEVADNAPISTKAMIHKGLIYYGTTQGRLFVRNILNGKLIYATDLGFPIGTAPLFYKDRLFVHLRNHSAVALDAKTGKLLWTYRRSVPYTTTLHRVAEFYPYANSVITGFADGSVGAISIDEGTILWEQKITTSNKFVDVDNSPIMLKERIVVSSNAGPVYYLNPKNGAIERTVNITAGHTPYLVNNETIAVGTIFGEVVLVDADGNILKRAQIAPDGITALTLWKKHLVVSTTNGDLLTVAPDNLKHIDRFMLGSSVSTVFGFMAQENHKLAVYSSRNRLYIFR